MSKRSFLLAVAALAAAGTALPAWAQVSPNLNPNQAKPVVPAAKLPSQSNAPPPGLPGAQVSPDSVAPADKSVADLSPNDALFDAINRGDIASARDALNRGADVDAVNVLGLTPLEQSIDLSRNNITFLLLSLRSTGSASLRPPSAKEAAAAAAAARAANAEIDQPAAPSPRAPRGRLPTVAANPTAATATPAQRRAPLFAGNGGAPNPSVGFLGFDQTR